MKFIDKNSVRKFQAGGPVGDPAMAGAPADAAAAPQSGQDQMMAQIEQMAVEIIQSIGPEGAAMLAEVIMTILQSQMQAGGNQGAPVFRTGGKLVRRVK